MFTAENERCERPAENREKAQAALRLMDELAKGRAAGENDGWLAAEDVRAHFKAKANEPFQ